MATVHVRYFDGNEDIITTDILDITSRVNEENESVMRFLRKRMSEFYQVKYCLYSWRADFSRCVHRVDNANFRGADVKLSK